MSISKPDIKSIQPELDSRFVKMDFDNNTSFDGWITLTSLGNKLKIELPVKKSKHYNLLSSKGQLRPGVRLSNKALTFMFEIPDTQQKENGNILGLDIGIKNVYSTSDNQQSKCNFHGWDLEKIQHRLSKRKKGSKGFEKAQDLRENFINWSINQLNLNGVKKLKLENIKHLRRGNKSSRYMSHWTYTTIYDKLEDYCNQSGVQIEKINPTYTSQRCSQCGWVRKNNRKGKKFKCTSCSFECDADLNASNNIVLELPTISREQRLRCANRKGFFWHVLVQEHIVSET